MVCVTLQSSDKIIHVLLCMLQERYEKTRHVQLLKAYIDQFRGSVYDLIIREFPGNLLDHTLQGMSCSVSTCQ